jgi:predicted TIM-barrel fold metal-dependent hydrolase
MGKRAIVPVVDFHVHIVDPAHLQPWAQEYMVTSSGCDMEHLAELTSSPELLVQMLRDSGVDYAVVLAEINPITTGVVSNEAVAAFCRNQETLIPFANINPFLTSDPVTKLERYVLDMGFKGLKLYPTYQGFYVNDSMVYPLYAKAEELGIPVMIHTGSSVFRGARLKYGDPLWIDDVAVDFPELTLIEVHGGRGFWYRRAFFLARLHSNVYVEIAGLPPHKLLDYFPELEKNDNKVIFGSDWPGLQSIRRNVEAIRSLPLGENTKAKILGGNAVRVLGGAIPAGLGESSAARSRC